MTNNKEPCRNWPIVQMTRITMIMAQQSTEQPVCRKQKCSTLVFTIFNHDHQKPIIIIIIIITITTENKPNQGKQELRSFVPNFQSAERLAALAYPNMAQFYMYRTRKYRLSTSTNAMKWKVPKFRATQMMNSQSGFGEVIARNLFSPI